MNYIYRFIDFDENVIYIGKTSNIKRRLKEHFTKGHLPKECYQSIAKFEYFVSGNKTDTEILETILINQYKPTYNTDKKFLENNSRTTFKFEETVWKSIYVDLNNPIEVSFIPFKLQCFNFNKTFKDRENELISFNRCLLNNKIGFYKKYMPVVYTKYGEGFFKEMEFIYKIALLRLMDDYSNLDQPIREDYTGPSVVYVAFSITILEEYLVSLEYLLIMLRCGLLIHITDNVLGIPIHTEALLKRADEIYATKVSFNVIHSNTV